ncbi:MAG: nucleotidyltransferase domain-containing protein [Acidobacteria bacterium]|nr:nucleotidyltransferase domain-containing protein [Acidobacteriota bacterium]
MLFPTVRKKVLGLLFGNPGRSFFLNEIVSLANSGTGAVQRELERLSECGLALTSRVGNQKHYQANPDSPIFDELCTLIKKTVGLVEPLRDALRSSHRKIHLAFVYGSVAKKTDHASTDIDLLVVSDEMILEDLYFLLSNVEAELNRKINPTLYTSAEFDDRLRTGNSFLSRVLKQPTIQLIGELPNGN